MTYPVNPADPTTPLNTQGAKQGAEEFRALKAYIQTLVIAATSGATVRQAIQNALRDANGFNNALTIGVGLRPGLSATVTPYGLSYANGFSGGKPLDLSEELIADVVDILGADLPTSNTSFIYRDYGLSFGSCLIPPQESSTFDRTQASLLHFEQSPPLCDFGNTYSITGATIDAVKFAYGTKAANLSGGAGTGANVKRIETAEITSLGPDSWEASCVTWFDVQPNAGVEHDLFSAVNNGAFGIIVGWKETGGNRRAHLYASSDGTSYNIANSIAGATNLATGIWYRFRTVFDILAGTYRVYVAVGGSAAAPVWGAEVQEISVASALKVCAITKVIWGCTYNGAYINGMSGWIDEARLIRAATKTTILTPGLTPDTYPLAIDAHPIHWMDITGKKMYKVTAASIAAGVNPTLTPLARIFLGEADTSGVAVTAVRNYAIQGNWVGLFTTPLPGLGVVVSQNHNLGGTPSQVGYEFECVTADGGYVVGDRVVGPIAGDDGAATYVQNTNSSRRTVGFTTATAISRFSNKATGARQNAATASWKYRLTAKRGW